MALTLLPPEKIPRIVIGGPADTPDFIDPSLLVTFMPVHDHLGADLALARERIQRAHLRGSGTANDVFHLDLTAFPGVSPYGAIIRLWELLRPDHALETYFFVADNHFEVGMLGVKHVESGWMTQLAEDIVPTAHDVLPADRHRTFTGALAHAAAAGTDQTAVVLDIATGVRR